MNNMIEFTESAARKVFELITEEANPKLMLRVFVQGGGCSGFQYGFTFEEEKSEDDFVISRAIAAKIAPPAGALFADTRAGSAASTGVANDEGGDAGAVAAGSLVNVNLLVDPLSYQYLQGAEIDYREDVNGSQFVIRNPNAKRTCGCGSSFSTE